jgi:hypothetical protein
MAILTETPPGHREAPLAENAEKKTVIDAVDLGHPTYLASKGRRVLFTFAGVGIAVIGTLLAGLPRKRTARTAQQSPAHQDRAG